MPLGVTANQTSHGSIGQSSQSSAGPGRRSRSAQAPHRWGSGAATSRLRSGWTTRGDGHALPPAGDRSPYAPKQRQTPTAILPSEQPLDRTSRRRLGARPSDLWLARVDQVLDDAQVDHVAGEQRHLLDDCCGRDGEIDVPMSGIAAATHACRRQATSCSGDRGGDWKGVKGGLDSGQAVGTPRTLIVVGCD